MKRKLLFLLVAGLLAVTGCQNKEETPADKQGVTEGIKEIFGDYIIEPNDALKTVFAKSWDVTGTEDVYVLEIDVAALLHLAQTFEHHHHGKYDRSSDGKRNQHQQSL